GRDGDGSERPGGGAARRLLPRARAHRAPADRQRDDRADRVPRAARATVADMDRAYRHLRQHRVRHISSEPQTLPAWNKNAGGIKAFYFADPDDHALE